MELFPLVVLVAAALCALVAGLLFTFAVVAMPGLKNLSDREFIRAFQVMDRVKGESDQKTIPLFYPNSTDVKWYKSPKFRVSQEGIWILRRKEIGEYTALDPLDFQRTDQLERIRRLLKDHQ